MSTTKLLNEAFEKYNAGLVTITELSNAVVLVETLCKAENQLDSYESAAQKLVAHCQELRSKVRSNICFS